MQTVSQQSTSSHPWEAPIIGPVSNVIETSSRKPLPGLTSLGFRPVDPAAKLGRSGAKSFQLPQDPAVIDGVTSMLSQTMRYRGFGSALPTIEPTIGSINAHTNEVAAKVKNHLDLHFQLMRGYHKITAASWVPSHPALGDLEPPRYNPLQTIRSRRARGQLPQKFLWTVSLSEEISDLSWRHNCYHSKAGLDPPVMPAASVKGHRRGPSVTLPGTPRHSARSITSDSDSPYGSAPVAAVMPVPARRLATPPLNPASNSPSRSPSTRDTFGSYQNFRENARLSSGGGLMKRLKAKHGDSSSASDDSDAASSRPVFSRSSSVGRTGTIYSTTSLPDPHGPAGSLTPLTSSAAQPAMPDVFGTSSVSVGALSYGSMSPNNSRTGLSTPPELPQVIVSNDDDNDNQVLPYYGSQNLSQLQQDEIHRGSIMSTDSLSVVAPSESAFSDDESEYSVEIIAPHHAADEQEQLGKAQDQLEYVISVFRIALQQTHQNRLVDSPCAKISEECGKNCEQLSTCVMPKYLEFLSNVESEVIGIQENLESGVGQCMDHLRVSTERMGSAVSTTLNRQLRETAARLDRLDSCTKSKCLYVIAYATLEYLVKAMLRVTWLVVKLFLVIKKIFFFFTRS